MDIHHQVPDEVITVTAYELPTNIEVAIEKNEPSRLPVIIYNTFRLPGKDAVKTHVNKGTLAPALILLLERRINP